MAQVWIVSGGRDKGGILVRESRGLTSTQLPERLACGALVRELELAGERLRYELVTGEGPASGWVSTRLKDKELLTRSPTTNVQPSGDSALASIATGSANAASASGAGGGAAATGRRPLPEGQLSAGEAVEWIMSASDDFESLMLPLDLEDDIAKIRTQYKRISLQVHPDKNQHPDAESAFRKLFAAMQRLTDPMQQRIALRRARRKGTGRFSEPPDEPEWWGAATVDEMERVFREMEETYAQMGVFDFQKARAEHKLGIDEDKLWISPEDAKGLLDKDLAIFLDSRDTGDFAVSHICQAHSLPGHTMEQLIKVELTDSFALVVQNPEQSVIVYSDNGSRLSRCTNVAKALRHRVSRPEQVLRLTGGLNLWKRLGLPVEGDSRALFAGKVLGASVPRLSG